MSDTDCTILNSASSSSEAICLLRAVNTDELLEIYARYSNLYSRIAPKCCSYLERITELDTHTPYILDYSGDLLFDDALQVGNIARSGLMATLSNITQMYWAEGGRSAHISLDLVDTIHSSHRKNDIDAALVSSSRANPISMRDFVYG